MCRALQILAIALTAMIVVASPARAAELKPSCTSPRSAIETLFYWQQPEHFDLVRAATCLPTSSNRAAKTEAARRLKSVYDSRGLYVQISSLPNDPKWTDPDTGLASVSLHSALPDIRVERQADGQWRFTRSALARVDKLYDATHGPVESLVRRLPRSLRNHVFGLQIWQYLALILLGALCLMLRKTLEFVIRAQIKELSERFGTVWATHLIAAIATPATTLIAAGLLRLAYPHLALPMQAAVVVGFIVRILVIFSGVWALYRLVDVFCARLAAHAAKTESRLDDQLVPLVRKSLKILVVIAGVLFLLQNLEVDVGSLLAGLGIGGLAFALAAKDTLANFFGSIMIFVDKPFQVGDWVVIKGAEGIVEEVGFRSTRIRTFYNSQISVPNAAFTEAQIDNYGRRQYRRTYVTLNVTYDTTPDQMQAFVEGIRAIIVANSYTRKDYYEVHMSGFGASSLDVMVYFFFAVPSWSVELRERHNVFLEIMRLAKTLGITFAFPTRTLHLESVASPGQPRTVAEPPGVAELTGLVESFGPGGEMARPKGPKIVAGSFAAKPELASYPVEGS